MRRSLADEKPAPDELEEALVGIYVPHYKPCPSRAMEGTICNCQVGDANRLVEEAKRDVRAAHANALKRAVAQAHKEREEEVAAAHAERSAELENALKRREAARIDGVKHALVQIGVASSEGVRLKIIDALWNEIYPEPGRQTLNDAVDAAFSDALKRREAEVWKEAAETARAHQQHLFHESNSGTRQIPCGESLANEFEQRAAKAEEER